MKTFSEKEIEERFQKLSPVLVEAIYSADNATAIVKLSEKYGITGRNISNVAGEIGYVILGLTKPEELPSRLTERLDMKMSDAALLAKDAYQNVLRPLAAELKRLYGFELNENVFGAKPPSPAAPQAEPQKPPPLVIPPRPILQQTPPAPRQAPPAPLLRPVVSPPQPPQPVPPPPQQAPKPTMPSPPPSQAPVKPLNIPRQTPMPPPAPPPALPPEQTEPRPPPIARAPLAPPMPPRSNAPRESMIAPPLPKPQTPPGPQAPRNIFSPQTPRPTEPPPPLEPSKGLTGQGEPARPAQEKPVKPPESRVFTSKRPASPRDIDDPYRETVAPQEKELQQKRDAVSDPRGPQPPFQVRKGEPPYVNPKIPPIDLREDAPRPPAPPDPHWEKLQ